MSECIQQRPSFSEQQAQRIASEFFDVEGVVTELAGERDQNFRILTNNDCYVLKLANLDTQREYLEFENQAIRLCQAIDDLNTPTLRKSANNESIVTLSDPRHESNTPQTCLARCFTFVPGNPLAEFPKLAPEVLESIGRFLAAVDKKLELLNHVKAARRILKWDLSAADAVIRQREHFVDDRADKKLIQRHLARYELVEPQIKQLKKSVIHNDPNDLNWILETDLNGSVTEFGLIDFGDCLYATTINDLAICCAYLILGRSDPMATAAHVIKGYNRVQRIADNELSVLYSLIGMRLCQSVAISAEQKRLRPNDPNLTVSEQAAWLMLAKLDAISPADLKQQLYDACYSATNANLDTADPRTTIIRNRKKHLAPSLSLSYARPLNIVRGQGQYLYDENGATYLDCVNNVCHVGHCHPGVTQSIANQATVLNTNTRYLHENVSDLAQRLAATLPEPLEVCFFVNSGSEANDLALRLATAYTHRSQWVVLDHAYHGHTKSLIDISPYKFNGPGGSGCAGNVCVLPIPDGFRGKFHYEQLDLGIRYADNAVDSIELLVKANKPPAAFIAESLLGCAGQIVLPRGYLKPIYEAIRAQDGVCIADEVQVGFGRVGKTFWGFQLQRVVPDIVTLGKPFGNGHPLAAVVTTKQIADSFNNGMEYFNTFGGNPVSCAAGLAVLNIVKNENLQEHALSVGTELKHDLVELKQKYNDRIGDVRGEGLFLGIEFVRDMKSKEPDAALAKCIVEAMKTKHVLLSADGPDRNVIKIKPPMIFDNSNAQRLVSTLDRVIGSLV